MSLLFGMHFLLVRSFHFADDIEWPACCWVSIPNNFTLSLRFWLYEKIQPIYTPRLIQTIRVNVYIKCRSNGSCFSLTTAQANPWYLVSKRIVQWIPPHAPQLKSSFKVHILLCFALLCFALPKLNFEFGLEFSLVCCLLLHLNSS